MTKIKKWIASYIQHRIILKHKRQADPKYRKFEFSKKLAVFSCVIMVISILLSVILALLDKDTITEITATVVTVCGGYLCSYGIKSAFEKNSRNKYGLDEFGNPLYGIESNESEETESEING